MVSYIPPDRQVIEIEKYIIGNDFPIIATGDGNYSETKVTWFDWGYRQIDNSFTSLLLRSKFKTSFNTEVLSGNYGIKAAFITAPGGLLKSDGDNFIDFEGFTEITTMSQLEQKVAEYNANLSEDQQEYKLMFNTSIMELSSKSMIGNIYNSSLSQEQAISFDISNYKNIVGCYICFFQDGDFKYQNLNGIENLITSDKSNLFLTHLSISFGYQEKDYEKEKDALEISTTDTFTYFPSTASNEINAKDIKIRWIHWDEEEKKHVYIRDGDGLGTIETEGLGTNLNHSLIIGPEEFFYGQDVESNETKYYNLSDDTKYEIYWYEEKIGALGDELSGFYWDKIKTTPFWNRQYYLEHMTENLASSRELQKKEYNGPVLSWLQEQKEKDKRAEPQEETNSIDREQIQQELNDKREQLNNYTEEERDQYIIDSATYNLWTKEEILLAYQEEKINEATKNIGILTIEIEDLETQLNDFSLIFRPIYNVVNQIVSYQTTLNRFSQLFNFVYCPITQNSSISLKAILVSRKLLEGQEQYEDEVKIAESKSLIFYNEQEIKIPEPGQLILTVEDILKEYFIYGENGQLENSNYDNQVFTIKANLPNFDETEVFNQFIITWNLPLINSMLDTIFPIDNDIGKKGDGTISSKNKKILAKQVQYGYNFFKYYPNSETWLDKDPYEIIETYFNDEENLQASIDYYGDTLSITYIVARKTDESFTDYLQRCENLCYQSYSIRNYYNSSLSNNTISCNISINNNEKKLWGEKTLVFGQNFSSGTSYNFSIFYKTDTPQGFFKSSENSSGYNLIQIVPQLHGKGISLSESESRAWLSGVNIAGTNEDSSFFELQGDPVWNENNEYVWTFKLETYNQPIDKFCELLKATVKVNNTVLTAYLSVPINALSDQYQGISAPTTMNYSSQGGRVNYNKDGLKLFQVPSATATNEVVRYYNVQEQLYSKATWQNFIDIYDNGLNNSKITITLDNSAQYDYINFVTSTKFSNNETLTQGSKYEIGRENLTDPRITFYFQEWESDTNRIRVTGLSQQIWDKTVDGTSNQEYLIGYRNKYGTRTGKIILKNGSTDITSKTGYFDNTATATPTKKTNKGVVTYNLYSRESNKNWYILTGDYKENDELYVSKSSAISANENECFTIKITKREERNGKVYYEFNQDISSGTYYLRKKVNIPDQYNQSNSNIQIDMEKKEFNQFPIVNAKNAIALNKIDEQNFEIKIKDDVNNVRMQNLITALENWKNSNPLYDSVSETYLDYPLECYLTLNIIDHAWQYFKCVYTIIDNSKIYLQFAGMYGAQISDLLTLQDFVANSSAPYMYYLYFPQYEVVEFVAEIGALEDRNAVWLLNATQISGTNDNKSYNYKFLDYGPGKIMLKWNARKAEYEFDENKFISGNYKINDNLITITKENGYPFFTGEIIDSKDQEKAWVQWYLNPYHVYTTNQEQVSLICYIPQSNKTLLPVWVQPLIIRQNLYEVEILNGWDGQTKIDNNYILSETIGAGSKNGDNLFSGVLMGKLLNIDDNNSINHGLYGFHEGAQSFGFKENGTAFIGKSGTGRIEFDGTKGVIASSGIGLNGSGSTGIYLDLQAPTFLLKSEGKNLINFSSSTQMLQSKDQGLKINLKNGKIESTNPISISTDDGLFKYGLNSNSDLANNFLFGGIDKGNGKNGQRLKNIPDFYVKKNGNIKGTKFQTNGFTLTDTQLSSYGSYTSKTAWKGRNFQKVDGSGRDEDNWVTGWIFDVHLCNIAIGPASSTINEYYQVKLSIFMPDNYGTDYYCKGWIELMPNFDVGYSKEHFEYYYGAGNKTHDNISKDNKNMVYCPLGGGFDVYPSTIKNKINANNKTFSLPTGYVVKAIAIKGGTYTKNKTTYQVTVSTDNKSLTFPLSTWDWDWIAKSVYCNYTEQYEEWAGNTVFGNDNPPHIVINQPNRNAINILDIKVPYKDVKDKTDKTNYFYIDHMGVTHLNDLRIYRTGGHNVEYSLYDYIKTVLKDYSLIK